MAHIVKLKMARPLRKRIQQMDEKIGGMETTKKKKNNIVGVRL